MTYDVKYIPIPATTTKPRARQIALKRLLIRAALDLTDAPPNDLATSEILILMYDQIHRILTTPSEP